jgi:hypothetical protein
LDRTACEAHSRLSHSHPAPLLFVLLALAATVASLAEARGLKQSVKVFALALAFPVTLVDLGAVFGKTLGEFLRNENG